MLEGGGRGCTAASQTWRSSDSSNPATIGAPVRLTGWKPHPKNKAAYSAPLPSNVSKGTYLRQLWVNNARAERYIYMALKSSSSPPLLALHQATLSRMNQPLPNILPPKIPFSHLFPLYPCAYYTITRRPKVYGHGLQPGDNTNGRCLNLSNVSSTVSDLQRGDATTQQRITTVTACSAVKVHVLRIDCCSTLVLIVGCTCRSRYTTHPATFHACSNHHHHRCCTSQAMYPEGSAFDFSNENATVPSTWSNPTDVEFVYTSCDAINCWIEPRWSVRQLFQPLQFFFFLIRGHLSSWGR